MATVFSQIIAGEIPSHNVYEDDKYLAFLTIDPFADGHTLVIPKKEYKYLWMMPQEEQADIWKVANKVAARIEEIFQPERVGVLVDGAEVPHTHIHIIPVQKGALTSLIRSHDPSNAPNHDKLKQIADKLKIKE